MTCAWCRRPMDYVHGHAACVNGRCAMFGLNQGECCDGESAESGARACDLAAGPRTAPPEPETTG